MTVVAGYVDAAGLLLSAGELKIFPAYMSGNTTRMMAGAAEGRAHDALLYAGVIALFALGVIAGRIVNDCTRRREGAALALEAVLLLTAAATIFVGGPERLALALLAVAMGCNDVALAERDGVGSKGYVTATFVHLMSAVADASTGRGAWSAAARPALTWTSLALGALAGASATVAAGGLDESDASVGGASVLLVPALVVGACGAIVLSGRAHA